APPPRQGPPHRPTGCLDGSWPPGGAKPLPPTSPYPPCPGPSPTAMAGWFGRPSTSSPPNRFPAPPIGRISTPGLEHSNFGHSRSTAPAPLKGDPPVRQPQPPTPPLPARYGEDRVTLLVRDPETLFAYWELTPQAMERACRDQGCPPEALTPLLRLHDLSQTGPPEEVAVGHAESWYLHVGRPGHRFQAELGFRGPGGGFTPISRSNLVATPPREPAHLTAPPVSRAEEVVLRQFRGVDEHGSPQYVESRAWKISLPLAEGSPLAWVTSPGASPAQAWAQPQEDLFLEVTAELILRGRTRPEATLWLNRERVPLAPDGTFTLRLALPDGSLPFGLEA